MDNKTIFLTGASKGIGKAIAELLGNKHKIVLFSRSLKDLNNVKKFIEDNGGQALVIEGDITNEDDVKNAVNKTLEKFGTIDVLINNAGIGLFKRIDQFTLDEFSYVQNVNLIGSFLATKYVSPILIKNKSGQIINISSVAGLTGFKKGTAYAASKFALVGFTESLREDLKEFGIAVTSVCAGGVRTEFGGGDPSKNDREFLLEPEDVARTIEYLVNESETANAKLIELKPRKRPDKR